MSGPGPIVQLVELSALHWITKITNIYFTIASGPMLSNSVRTNRGFKFLRFGHSLRISPRCL